MNVSLRNRRALLFLCLDIEKVLRARFDNVDNRMKRVRKAATFGISVIAKIPKWVIIIV